MTTIRVLIVDYSDGQPIEIDGEPVGVLHHNINQKRITLLVQDTIADELRELEAQVDAEKAAEFDVEEWKQHAEGWPDDDSHDNDEDVELPFDPADYNVDDLTEKVAGYGPTLLTLVLEAEEDGKARKSAVSMLKQAINDAA